MTFKEVGYKLYQGLHKPLQETKVPYSAIYHHSKKIKLWIWIILLYVIILVRYINQIVAHRNIVVSKLFIYAANGSNIDHTIFNSQNMLFVFTTKVQVDKFLSHYRYYMDDFWLFQIPHHSSSKSNRGLLHTNIPSHT